MQFVAVIVQRPLVSVLVLVVACSAREGGEEESGVSTGAIIAGTGTFERPEIGELHHASALCTATLIRSNVVLSAAHCVTGSPKDEAETGYTFTIVPSATASRRFAIDRVYSVPTAADFDGSDGWRTKDIALFRLTSAVPSSLARPAGVATAYPWPGARVTLYGYGCDDRATHANYGTKRKKDSTWTLLRRLGWSSTESSCPGDSGGPLLDVGANAVLGTTSGYVNDEDRFGDLPGHADLVNRIADGWAAR